jgi:ABC-type Na+ transport system ATPase subunit NatA
LLFSSYNPTHHLHFTRILTQPPPHSHIHTRTHTHTYAHAHTHARARTHTHTHTHTHARTHTVGDNVDVLDNDHIPHLLRRVGYVMQLETPWDIRLTLRENLLYAAELRLPTAAAAVAAVDRVIAMLDMDSFADTVVGDQSGGGGLSGGEKRKLCTAIQLVYEPDVLLLDEPTSGLDAASTLALIYQLRRLGEAGKMILIAVHQPRREVWDLFHHVVCFSEGQVVYVETIPSVLLCSTYVFHFTSCVYQRGRWCMWSQSHLLNCAHICPCVIHCTSCAF